MTARRTLGTGPEAPSQSIRAAQADLLDALPGIRLPDLGELRARGVLGAQVKAAGLVVVVGGRDFPGQVRSDGGPLLQDAAVGGSELPPTFGDHLADGFAEGQRVPARAPGSARYRGSSTAL
ncbi:hypothetical protein [Streptomyces atratus]|uniref:hypothetical protein n=1 Tax=Streptomyces atratus TaxID=1893 RepID=UPI00379A09AD